MGQRTSYTPGTFSWVDLSTPDAAAARAFYGRVFGWEAEQEHAVEGTGDPGAYTLFRRDGAAVAGLSESAGADPPRWTSYVTVADADAAAARAGELGGRVVEAARDVGEEGRTAALADPQGAGFAVWQPGRRYGAEWVNDVGCLTMNELATTDLDAARAFYEALFGWTTGPIDTGPDGPPMAFARNGETLNASFSLTPPGVPPHWRPYFTVESTAASVAQVREQGGTEVLAPLEVPGGSIAVVLDPQGALFALFAGRVDP
jgi:predicted enzyme related to lactoylglutathione lyase